MEEVVCSVCGESGIGRAHLLLALFAVVTDRGDGMGMRPEREPHEIKEWEELEFDRLLHPECVQAYVDGLVAEANVLRSKQ